MNDPFTRGSKQIKRFIKICKYGDKYKRTYSSRKYTENTTITRSASLKKFDSTIRVNVRDWKKWCIRFLILYSNVLAYQYSHYYLLYYLILCFINFNRFNKEWKIAKLITLPILEAISKECKIVSNNRLSRKSGI